MQRCMSGLVQSSVLYPGMHQHRHTSAAHCCASGPLFIYRIANTSIRRPDACQACSLHEFRCLRHLADASQTERVVLGCMQLYKHLKSKGFSEGLQLWLGSSLVNRKSGGLEWTFNIEGAADMYDDYQVQEFWDVVSSPPAGLQLNLVRAERSDR